MAQTRPTDPDKLAAKLRQEASEQAQAEGYATALVRERQGYVTRGLGERVAQVDAELTRVGRSDLIPADEGKGRKAAS